MLEFATPSATTPSLARALFDALSLTDVPRLHSVDRTRFQHDFYQPQLPAVMPSLSEGWSARQNWSVDFLRKELGDLVVPLYSSKPATGKSHQHAAACHLPLAEYLDRLENGENDLRVFFYNLLQNAPQLMDDFDYPDLGMKFFKRLPVLFMGGRNTKVQMHFDIDLAHLILCHFGGPKSVLLFPPDQSKLLYQVPYSFSALHQVDFSEPDFDRFPALQQAKGYRARLEHGDTLYIPSGYWHFIVYEDVGFSMTLRSMPTDAMSRVKLMRNIFVTRTVEGVMRKVFGQKWNDRNERLAVERVHERLQLTPELSG